MQLKADKLSIGAINKKSEDAMIKVEQMCRVCGKPVPSGFTNCDGCYRKGEASIQKR